TDPDINLTVAGSLSYREGALVKGSDATIYVIDDQSGTLVARPFSSWSVFKGLGYSISAVQTVPDSTLPSAGSSVSSSSVAHPDGTLVQEDGSVYLVKDGDRLAIPSPAVLYSQGYNWSMVKAANTADMGLPEGSALNFREGTLLKTSA